MTDVALGMLVGLGVVLVTSPWGEPGRTGRWRRAARAGRHGDARSPAVPSGRTGLPGAARLQVVDRTAASTRWSGAAPEPVVRDAVMLLELVDAALTTGAALPRVLAAVGRAVGGRDGAALVRASSALMLGASWPAAWSGAPPVAAEVAAVLGPAWDGGAAPGPVLRAHAERLRRDRRATIRQVAGALGARLVLPLGLCFLPAFVLLGVVPMVLSLAADLWGR